MSDDKLTEALARPMGELPPKAIKAGARELRAALDDLEIARPGEQTEGYDATVAICVYRAMAKAMGMWHAAPRALPSDNLRERVITTGTFLLKAAVYFEGRDTHGEDQALWANVFNGKNCRDAIELLKALNGEITRLTAEIARLSADLEEAHKDTVLIAQESERRDDARIKAERERDEARAAAGAMREALELAVRQNRCDMILTGDELRKCERALSRDIGAEVMRVVRSACRVLDEWQKTRAPLPFPFTDELVNLREDVAALGGSYER